MKLIRLILPLFLLFLNAASYLGDYYEIGMEPEESQTDPLWDPLLTPDEGSMLISGIGDFYSLSVRGELQGKLLMSEVKFIVTDVQTDSPKLYFLNSSSYKYHWKFYSQALEWNIDLYSFNTRTYTDFNRRIIAGSVVRYDSYISDEYPTGIYTFEFWPSDPIHAEDAHLVHSLLQRGMPYAEDILVYHPIGETQVRIHSEEISQFENLGVEVIQTASLYHGVDYFALNTGIAYGILRSGELSGTFSTEDIVVFETIPNDISHVAGVITTIPQTPLSHINLKARQNGTPNVFIQDFHLTEDYQAMINSYVKLTVYPDGYTISAATPQEALQWLESVRPDSTTVLEADLSQGTIQSLHQLRLEDTDVYGAKACGLGELSVCLPSGSVPQGFAVPFIYYHEFMKYNGFYQMVDSLTALPEFNTGAVAREAILAEIQANIRSGSIPPELMNPLTEMAAQFDPQVSLRCRSSTNNEDLPGFNGAGLYESYTHHPHEGHISETLKQVWAGLWTYRAFEEREFHRIDHISAAMGVVVHPSFKDETANGVAVTQNISNPFVTGYYVNVQLGEDMVTNPLPESVPEEFLITNQRLLGAWQMEIQYTGSSNRLPEGQRVLSPEHIEELSDYLDEIHSHFADCYGFQEDDVTFAMEIEFKITSENQLVVKQARPWVN